MKIRLKSFIWVIITVSLIAINLATVLNSRVYDLVHGVLDKIPYSYLVSNSKASQLDKLRHSNAKLKQQNKMLQGKYKARKHHLVKAKVISKRISNRVVRNVGLNTSSVIGESIPYLGIALILSVTARDIYDGCQTIKDANELLLMLEEEPDTQSETKVCGIVLPTSEDIHNGASELFSEYLN